MGGKIMIKNLIIVALLIILVSRTDMSLQDFLDYTQIGLDKIQELLYTIKRSV